MPEFVEAFPVGGGEMQHIPAHWLTHPVLSTQWTTERPASSTSEPASAPPEPRRLIGFAPPAKDDVPALGRKEN